jgi:hypothetical protein
MDSVTVAAGLGLRNKPDRRSVCAGGLYIRGFVAGPNDNGNLVGPRRERLFDENTEQRFLVAVAVY